MAPNGSPDHSENDAAKVWSFGGCEFDDSRLELRVAGRPVELELKPMEVLVQLLHHSGETLTKDRLLDTVWPGLTVVDGSLATAVSKLRKAIGDQDGSMVVTVPRVGYRMGVAASSRPSQQIPAKTELEIHAGDWVPGRPNWQLTRPLALPEDRGVWLAENPKTHEQRVFKFAVRPSRIRNLKREVTVSRFLLESLGPRSDFARLLEWNFEAQPYFIESEYGGLNLVEWAESQGGLSKIPLTLRLQILVQAARAVAIAHGAGVLHRDLKPTNVLVAPVEPGANAKWQVQVVDFGSASLVEPERLEQFGITNLGLTQTVDPRATSLTGTLMYMAPELFSGKASSTSGDVYALGVMLYQLVAGDLRKPLAAGWESLVPDPLLREDVADAACVDPSRRLASAAELADRLDHLEERRRKRELEEQQRERERLAQHKAAAAQARRPWVILAGIALVFALAIAAKLFWRSGSAPPQPKTIAVLSFQNTASDPSIDFLRFALADEVATTLSHMRPLSILPLANTARYSAANDLQKAGRELGANYILTGHFLKFGQQLQIGMELVDVATNRILWRDTVNVPADSLLAMQAQVAASTMGKLAPLLGASAIRNAGPPPKNEQAYSLYLRSLAESNDPAPNKHALELLRESVAIDPGYAPAWAALAVRAYDNSRWGGGGEAVLQESDAAAQRALALDPDYIDPTAELIVHRAERGQLAQAYESAKDLVNRRPDSGGAHHTLGYVLRYAGLLDEAGHQCDLAQVLDPDALWGSCSTTFMEAGNYRRAMDFIQKNFGSEWTKAHAIEIFVRAGDPERSLKLGAPQVQQWPSYKMLLACIQHEPSSEIDAMAAGIPTDDDPEVAYLVAGHLAYCGEKPQALAMLRHAITAGYCSYPALDKDPMFATIRNEPEFADLRSKAMACRKSFQDAVGDHSD
jgi:serine/threonine protein kinase/DNA-binding winged helix-turn-helix (wHTH) protein